MWYNVEQQLPEKSTLEDSCFEEYSIKVLVKGKELRPMVAFWVNYEGSIEWLTDCSERWNITDVVEYWARIPE